MPRTTQAAFSMTTAEQAGEDPTDRARQSAETSGIATWWYRLTAPPMPPPGASFPERERARRARIASMTSIAVFLVVVFAVPIAWNDGAAMFRVVVLFACTLVALVFNRLGRLTLAGLALIAGAEVGPVAGLLITPTGQLGVGVLSVHGLFVISELLAVALLRPVSVIIVALFNSLFIALDMVLMPHTPALQQILQTQGYAVIERPVMVQLFVAFATYTWVKVALQAMQRADRAEELYQLRQRETERARALDDGVASIQLVLVQLANGNFRARVPVLRDSRLWQVGKSLNHFIGRFERLGQMDFILQREQDEARRLAQAVDTWRMGRKPIWPVPTGLPLDTVLAALRNLTETDVATLATGGVTQSAPPDVDADDVESSQFSRMKQQFTWNNVADLTGAHGQESAR